MFMSWEKGSTGETLGGSDLVTEAGGGDDDDAIVRIPINNADHEKMPSLKERLGKNKTKTKTSRTGFGGSA